MSDEPSRQMRTICWCGEWRQHEHAPGETPSTAAIRICVSEADLVQWEALAAHAQQHIGLMIRISPEQLMALVVEVRRARAAAAERA